MKKEKLISLLQQINGNPDILLWNGFVGDWVDIKSEIVPYDITKITKEYWLESCRLEECIDSKNKDAKLSQEEIWNLTNQWKKAPWEVNEFVTHEDIQKKRYRAKTVYFINAKTKGEEAWDRTGSIKY